MELMTGPPVAMPAQGLLRVPAVAAGREERG
jgi:hypothetical protein